MKENKLDEEYKKMMEMTLNAYKDSEHPWGKFLWARIEAIKWMSKEMRYCDFSIANRLSMDHIQVHSIINAIERYEKEE